MKRNLIYSLLLVVGFAASLQAQTTLYSFGPTTGYTTVGRPLTLSDGTTAATTTDQNRSFSTLQMSPLSGSYLGPEFFGGWKTTGSSANNLQFAPQVADNFANAGGNDAILLGFTNVTGTPGTIDALIMGSIASTDLGDLDTFTLGAQLNISGSARAVIRIGSSYYVGDAPGSSNVTGTYGTTSLGISNWFTYDPGSDLSIVGSSAATLSATDQVDAVGVHIFRDTTPVGTADTPLSVGEFTVTAIPEPGTYALIGGMLALAAVMMRRRRA